MRRLAVLFIRMLDRLCCIEGIDEARQKCLVGPCMTKAWRDLRQIAAAAMQLGLHCAPGSVKQLRNLGRRALEYLLQDERGEHLWCSVSCSRSSAEKTASVRRSA